MERAIAPAAAWLAFMAGLIAGGDVVDLGSFAVGAVTGAALVLLGYAAAWRTRTVRRDSGSHWMRRAGIAVAVGIACGLANLAANWAIATSHPALRELLVQRFAAVGPLVGVVAAPLTEEVTVRLFLMSAVAWVVSRFTKDPAVVFAIALLASSLVFAVLHLGRPFPGDPTVARFYRAALLTKYTLAGLPMGWLFWRRGLPYAMACHAAVNATHLIVQPLVF